MLGNCFGTRISDINSHVDLITANYAPVGITEIKIIVNGDYISLGNAAIGSTADGKYPKVTEWLIEPSHEFVGFQAW